MLHHTTIGAYCPLTTIRAYSSDTSCVMNESSNIMMLHHSNSYYTTHHHTETSIKDSSCVFSLSTTNSSYNTAVLSFCASLLKVEMNDCHSVYHQSSVSSVVCCLAVYQRSSCLQMQNKLCLLPWNQKTIRWTGLQRSLAVTVHVQTE